MIHNLQKFLALFGMVFIIYLSPTCAMGQGSIDEIEKTEATKAYSLQHLLSQLPPELLLKIFESLDHDWEAIANLSMSCKDCYKISRSPEYINSFKFSSLKLLTQECIDYLFATAAGGSIPQVISRLIAVQNEEIAHLTNILTKVGHKEMYFEGAIIRPSKEKSVELLVYINFQIVEGQKEQLSERIFRIENMLDYINTAIIKEKKADFFPSLYHRRIFIDLDFSISRLPLAGVKHIKDFCYMDIINNIDPSVTAVYNPKITLKLLDNFLRWLPREIFEFGQLESLNLSNNCLISLPESLTNHSNSLTCLRLDNYYTYKYTRAPERFLIGKNYFEKIPPCVFKLKKLIYLCMNNVGMKEFDMDQVSNNLSDLEELALKDNKIISLSQVEKVFSNRIMVYAAGNPNVYDFRFCKYVSCALATSLVVGLVLFYT